LPAAPHRGDHWQVLKDGEDGVYKDWWKGKNVHFSGAELNGPLAQALADKVLAALAKRQQRIQGG